MLAIAGVLMALLGLPVFAHFAQIGLGTAFEWPGVAVWTAPVLSGAGLVWLGRRIARHRPEVLALDATGIRLGGRLVPWAQVDEVALDRLSRNRSLVVHRRDPGGTGRVRQAAYRAAHSRMILLDDIDARPETLLQTIRDVAIEGGCQLDPLPDKPHILRAGQSD